MSAQQTVRLLGALVREGEPAFEEQFGPQAVSAAQDMAALLENRLDQESPYVSLWADFRADPDGTASQLTGALEALVEADPALGRRLEGFVRECYSISGAPGIRPDANLQDAVGEDKAWGRTVALEPDPDVGQGEYLYGNLAPGAVEARSVKGQPMDWPEGLDHIVRVGLAPPQVPQLLTELYAAIDTHPEIDPITQQDLKAELTDVLDEAALGVQADAAQLGRHLRNIGRMHPDILQALLDRLTDPEFAWEEGDSTTSNAT
jgi:hypothetical protein